MRSKKRQQQFIIARFLLSQGVFLQTGNHCKIKPLKSGQPKIIRPSLFCSISHSENSIAVGFSGYAIGLDVEQHKERNLQRLVNQFFHPQEMEEFSQLPDKHKAIWFYQNWTRKESAAKLTGIGITQKILAQTKENTERTATLKYYQGSNYTLSCIQKTPNPACLFKVKALNTDPWIETIRNRWH